MNKLLALRVIQDGRRDFEISRAAGVDSIRFSKIKNGHAPGTDQERAAIAKALGCALRDVFPADPNAAFDALLARATERQRAELATEVIKAEHDKRPLDRTRR